MKIEVEYLSGEKEILEYDKLICVDRPEAKTTMQELYLYNGACKHILVRSFNILTDYEIINQGNMKIYIDKRADL